ncbi:MAG: chorismate mutase [Deltaproteobacteria bacterium]|nr:chorismate mutase [Deltaproteobacteria bacterium]
MSLKEIRKQIDLLDSRILRTLNDRMELALMASKFKREVEDSEREKEVLEAIRRNTTGLINAELVEKIYMEIIKESKIVQKKDYKLIGFRGEHGAYGEVAAREWNPDYVPVPCAEFSDIFEGVKSGKFDYGIVSVENSLGGIVGEVNELIINTELKVAGAVELPIYLCLMTLPGYNHRELHSVFSSSQALAQCRNFIARNKLDPVQFYDTAGAAKMLAEKVPKASAVIASKLASEIYNLDIIKEDIDDFERNRIRYLILANEEDAVEGDKCSILFSAAHRVGSLFSVLELFAKENINLTRIGSISSGKGDYAFFLDFIGSEKDENVRRVLERLRDTTSNFRLMGCYKEKTVE